MPGGWYDESMLSVAFIETRRKNRSRQINYSPGTESQEYLTNHYYYFVEQRPFPARQ